MSRVSVLAAASLFAWSCGDGTTDPPEANNSPVASGTIPSQTVYVGNTVTLRLSQYFSDPDGDVLTFTAQSANTNVATVSVSGSNAVVTGVSPGNTTVTVTASDPDGLTAQQSFTVSVPNRAPEPVGTMPERELFVGDTVRTDVSRYFNDPDGDALTYTARSANTGVATVSVSGSSAVVTGVSQGNSTITVTASDPGGMTVDQDFSVVVGPRPHPELEFTTGSAAAPEGAGVTLTITATPAPDSTLEVGYTIGSDDDPDTDNADGADHAGGSGGVLRFKAGATRATIKIAVHDDNDIEPTREVLAILIDPPEEGAGYTLGEPATAELTIEEGVCDRTPQVRDKLVALARVDHCRKTVDSHLAAIDTLDLQGPRPMARQGRQDARAEHWSCRLRPKSIPERADTQLGQAMSRICAARLLHTQPSPRPSPNQGDATPGEPIAALRAGDFLGLTGMVELWLLRNRLTALPAGVFAGLDELQRLHLGFNRLTEGAARGGSVRALQP